MNAALAPALGPVYVVAALVPGAAIGLACGRSRTPLWIAVAAVLALEVVVQAAVGVPAIGPSAYVAMVGRAARRTDPRLEGYAPRVALFGDILLPLAVPGVLAGSALAFAAQVASRIPEPHGVAGIVAAGVVATVAALAALAIDRQHADALAEAGAQRGSDGPALLPHFTVAEHVALAPEPLAEADRAALAPVWHRRPRHLDPAQRERLARCVAAPR